MKTTQAYVESLSFWVLPGDKNSRVAYAADEAGVWEKTQDEAGRSYRFALYDRRANAESLEFRPHSGMLPRYRQWLNVNVIPHMADSERDDMVAAIESLDPCERQAVAKVVVPIADSGGDWRAAFRTAVDGLISEATA